MKSVDAEQERAEGPRPACVFEHRSAAALMAARREAQKTRVGLPAAAFFQTAATAEFRLIRQAHHFK
ncbi:hypothetical protein HLH36_00690 [Gluconacetobacter aggeris]|uniref:Uncharacterized protein n=1 Tax=Gluconacetobacter aggeris TaxID=1286186 RepID=A0A7W4IPV3_9PROT|nr:hypothetical protein [Gluconacetobacter aggeris]MBB2166885.1 hypothetical protein [Gluconacetobacter aggeris]